MQKELIEHLEMFDLRVGMLGRQHTLFLVSFQTWE